MTNNTHEQPQHNTPMLKPHGLLGGTPVHTRDGLVPIDQLKVGDWVLSKPESGIGEVSYKRVLSTMAFDETEIWCVGYSYRDWETGDAVSARLFATVGHRFWVPGRLPGGTHYPESKVEMWFALEELDDGDLLLLGNGGRGLVSAAGPVCKMRNSDQGAALDLKWDYLCFTKVDFSGDYPTCSDFSSEEYALLLRGERFEEGTYCGYYPIRRKVYNIEVEDHHSYFVGKAGVWVHSATE